MNMDFSHLNVEYLVQARDLARADPRLTASILYMPNELAQSLAALTPAGLAQLTQIKMPLLVPRPETWWWSRLFQAIQDGDEAEVRAIMDHAGLFVISDGNGGKRDERA